MRILIAEDENDIADALVTIMQKNNYCADSVNNGNDAFEYANSGNYDAVILDIMMPGMDGIEVLTELRKCGNTVPVLLLTARSELSDRVNGLDCGADDYLPKPFAVPKLMARVRAMLRRRSNYLPDVINVNNVQLNKSTMEVEYKSAAARLVLREFQVLEVLMDNVKRIISTDYLMERIWGWDSNVDVSIVWVTISGIRKKLLEINAPLIIRTVRGVGYVMEKTECSKN